MFLLSFSIIQATLLNILATLLVSTTTTHAQLTPTDAPCPPEGAEGTPLTGLDWAVVNRDEPSFYFGRLFSHFITMVCMTELPFLEALPNLIQSSPIT